MSNSAGEIPWLFMGLLDPAFNWDSIERTIRDHLRQLNEAAIKKTRLPDFVRSEFVPLSFQACFDGNDAQIGRATKDERRIREKFSADMSNRLRNLNCDGVVLLLDQAYFLNVQEAHDVFNAIVVAPYWIPKDMLTNSFRFPHHLICIEDENNVFSDNYWKVLRKLYDDRREIVAETAALALMSYRRTDCT